MDSRLRGNDAVLSWRTRTAIMDSHLFPQRPPLSFLRCPPAIPEKLSPPFLRCPPPFPQSSPRHSCAAPRHSRTDLPAIPALPPAIPAKLSPVIPAKAGIHKGAPIIKQSVVYIMASKAKGTLYMGVTSNLKNRMWEHRTWLSGNSDE